MILEHLVVGPLQVNCFILGCEESGQAIVIDPGGNPRDIQRVLTDNHFSLVAILATHAHFDHILAVQALKDTYHVPFYLHPADEPVLQHQRSVVQQWLGFDPGPMPQVDVPIKPGELFTFGEIRLEIRHTPGHSPGSVTFIDHEGHRAFVGDLIFAGAVGRTDLPGGNFDTLLQSIRRVILTLPDDFQLLPGHGTFTTVAQERVYNPYLSILSDS